MVKLYKDQIIDEFEACPYCGDQRLSKISCCSEIHFEVAYDIGDSQLYFESEIEWIADPRPIVNEILERHQL